MAMQYIPPQGPFAESVEDEPVPKCPYPPTPEALARVDAWLAALTPEEKNLLDRLDSRDDR